MCCEFPNYEWLLIAGFKISTEGVLRVIVQRNFRKSPIGDVKTPIKRAEWWRDHTLPSMASLVDSLNQSQIFPGTKWTLVGGTVYMWSREGLSKMKFLKYIRNQSLVKMFIGARMVPIATTEQKLAATTFEMAIVLEKRNIKLREVGLVDRFRWFVWRLWEGDNVSKFPPVPPEPAHKRPPIRYEVTPGTPIERSGRGLRKYNCGCGQ